MIPFIGKKLIKVFTGQRRVGKSYLLFQVMNHVPDQEPQAPIIYVNKEDLAFSDIKTAEDLCHFVVSNKHETKKTYVFIAENGGEKHYYQVALSMLEPAIFDREYGKLRIIDDNYPKTVITYDRFEGSTLEGIKNMDLRSFLSSP